MKVRDLPISYVAILLDVAENFGASKSELLNLAGMDEATLENPEARCPEETFRVLLNSAIQKTGKHSLTLHFGQQLTLTSHGVFGYAVMSCRNIQQVIDILTKYYRLLLNNVSLIVKTEDDRISIEFHPARTRPEDCRHDTELFFAGLLSSIKHLLHIERVDAEVELEYPAPDYREDYQTILDCPVHFDQKISRIGFPIALMDEKPEYANPAMLKLYEQQCEELLSRMQSSEGLRVKVREYLVSAKQQFPSLEQAASHFYMSPRTFRRRLSDENVSFQKILDEVRRELAETYLRNPAISVNHTADLLGFHDVSNFRRAFIRWSDGISPSEFKKQHAHH
ncbi:AraC family transcriptional regulator [Aestuariicella hydrocarbonica]|uniref:AraC family transcriptional regulator n=1 Tax=Pseudomaricurvus hydrocarbonicus TaxID=1470433 RepID=A0A9E5JUM3_9GAMM|nr:AraC family transcriptional regulator [Aestuariicella hydrocarbonica]NHO65200.1 AraC family transcriptional regulator [Aestuariicella hydrocarbonica]